MFQLERVTVRHPNNYEALRAIDARIPAGGFVRVIGRTGAGKTTLLRLLAGEQQPTEGRVLADGVDLGTLSPTELALRRRRIGRLTRTPELLPELDVAGNVGLPLELQGLARQLRDNRVAMALEAVGLEAHAKTPPGWLNRHERQLASLARAIAMEPDLILADEPQALLDREGAADLEGRLRRLATPLRTVILTSREVDPTQAGDGALVMLLNQGFLIDGRAGASAPGRPSARPA
jgi:ABC-type ATPase involved in cell division